MTLRALLLASFISSLVLLGSCQPRAIPANPAVSSKPWPEFDYAAAARQGKRIFRLVPALSQVDILVRREGPLARLGHDHVISIRNAEGYLLLEEESANSRAELRFRVEELDVDPAQARTFYQLDTEPDPDDIAATRRNLLDKVLDAEHWPFLLLSLSDFISQGQKQSATAVITVTGIESESPVNFTMDVTLEQALIKGKLDILQTELGLEPLSVMGGSLRVADHLEVHFSLTADLLISSGSP